MSFVLGGKRYTVAYLDDPGNPKEARFSEREYGRFGSYFEYTIEQDKPLTVNYRLWLQEGLMQPEEVAALRPLPHSRRHGKVTEQLTNLLSHFFAVHDHIDQAMLLEKFSGLKSFWQFLMSGFFDHTRPCETDHAFGLSNNHVA